jgi:hypothetical protein
MRPEAAADRPAATFGWPRSPAVLFGIAAAFFVVSDIVLVKTGLLAMHLPVVQDGQVTQVPIGSLWLMVAGPFAIFAVIYAGIELKAERVFEPAPTRIHFVCTLFAVLEAIRVYLGWASTTASPTTQALTLQDFRGVGAFLVLAAATFIWNLSASRLKPPVSR